MSKNAVMPMEDYVAACDNIREKTETTDLIKSGELPEKINDVYEAGREIEHSRMWDVLQPNGNGEYNYNSRIGYFGSGKYTFDNFYPEYDIRPVGDADYLFYDWGYGYGNVDGSFIQRFKECGVMLDTSKATSMNNIFAYNKAIDFPTVDFSSAIGVQSGCFNACSSATKIEKIIVNENVGFNNWFESCVNLEEVIFEGVIGQNGLDFSPCTKLSKASFMNNVIKLSPYTMGLSITFSLAAVKKAFETSEGANDGNTSDAWLTLCGRRDNWTISLA